MTSAIADAWTAGSIAALDPLRDDAKAEAMAAYMKNVSSFLGIPAPVRRTALVAAWRPLPRLDETTLVEVCESLWELPEREYQYAACDLIARNAANLSPGFIPDVAERLLTSRPWWDTVDALGSGAVTPIVTRHEELVDLMWGWIDSGDRWLVRAAVQHQRGLRERTNLDLLFAMCDAVASDREFFIAKAVGWALRDTTAFAPDAVQEFVDEHPQLSAVARREAVRGLARSARP